jgi:two-component system nitrate/nitrite response regulator NarL
METVVVGPSALVREGLSRILTAAHFRVLASASCIADVPLSSLAQRRSLLLIIEGDDASAIVSDIQLFKQQQSTGRIAVLAHHYQQSDMISIFRAGANAYLVRETTGKAVIKSLELVMLGETVLPSAALSVILDGSKAHNEVNGYAREKKAELMLRQEGSQDTPRLSAREKGILSCLVAGDTNKMIARKIDIAEATVKVHVKAILRKIRVQNRTQAAIWATNNSALIFDIEHRPPAPAKLLPYLSKMTKVEPALLSAILTETK